MHLIFFLLFAIKLFDLHHHCNNKACLNNSYNWEDIFFENLSNIYYKFCFNLYGKNND